jgi:hypothetical protein
MLCFVLFSLQKAIISLNNINYVIFVMVSKLWYSYVGYLTVVILFYVVHSKTMRSQHSNLFI